MHPCLRRQVPAEARDSTDFWLVVYPSAVPHAIVERKVCTAVNVSSIHEHSTHMLCKNKSGVSCFVQIGSAMQAVGADGT